MALRLPYWLVSRLDPVDILLRGIVALVFIDSGLGKLRDPLGFADTVRNYQMVGDPWVAWIAMAVPCALLIIAACLFLRVLYPGCVIAAAGLLCGFVTALVSLLARGLDIDCGCLSFKFPISIQIMIDVILIGICGLLLWMWRRETRPREAE